MVLGSAASEKQVFGGNVERYLLIAIGGALGSCARFAAGTLVSVRYGSQFPWGTLVVNVTGSFLIGVFLAWTTERVLIDPRWRFFLAVGVCGGYTTFSSFAYDTMQLITKGYLLSAFGNVALSTVASVAAVFLGVAFGRLV
ncbi:MAG: fluoride efflux transporter CrcB [Planctomycetota bacterium]